MDIQILHTAIAEWHGFTVKMQHENKAYNNDLGLGYYEAMKHMQKALEQIGRFAGMELNTLEWEPCDTDEAELLNREAVC